MGQIEKNIAGLEPPAVEGLTRAPFPISKDLISADLGYGDECVIFNTRGERVNLE